MNGITWKFNSPHREHPEWDVIITKLTAGLPWKAASNQFLLYISRLYLRQPSLYCSHSLGLTLFNSMQLKCNITLTLRCCTVPGPPRLPTSHNLEEFEAFQPTRLILTSHSFLLWGSVGKRYSLKPLLHRFVQPNAQQPGIVSWFAVAHHANSILCGTRTAYVEVRRYESSVLVGHKMAPMT